VPSPTRSTATVVMAAPLASKIKNLFVFCGVIAP
jgi:hypothetical protein